MTTEANQLASYLLFLEGKGFKLKDDAINFIYFGKQWTGASDQQIIIAIEVTLKVQKQFDGSFYMSILEILKENKIHTKHDAYRFLEEKGMLKAHGF